MRWGLIWAALTTMGATAAGLTTPALAEGWVMARTLPAGSLIEEGDLRFDDHARGSVRSPDEVIGREARVTLYEGRPIRGSDTTRPTLIERNQTVTLDWVRGPLRIQTEGRALAKGGAGDVIRVMNTTSHTTISARITADGTLEVIGQ